VLNPSYGLPPWVKHIDARHFAIPPSLSGGEAIQQVPLFPLSPILFDASKDYHESETNCPETNHQWFCDRVNAFLSIREEPYYSLDVVRVNKLSIGDFGLS